MGVKAVDSEYKVPALCLFCQAPLESEKGTEIKSGDLIKCKECGEDNDYDSVIKVIAEKEVEKVKSEITADLKNSMKNLFQ